MQRSKLGVWLLCLLLSLSLLASCGGGDKETEKGGTFSSKGSAAAGANFDRGSQVEESAVSAEDFYGCWEYEGLDIWMCIYDDGTYERFWGIDASSETGTYSIEGNQLVLEYGLSYSLEEPGRIVDSDGDPMIPSELPDIAWNAQGDGRGDLITEEPAVNFEDFFGCWEYVDFDIWVYIYGDGTYEMYDANGDGPSGSYTPEGTEIVLDSGDRFALGEDGGLVDGEGYELFASELPDFAPTPYFDEHGIEIGYALDDGDVILEDGAYYYVSETNGEYYGTAPIVCSIVLESEEDLGNGYIERVITCYQAFREEDIPLYLPATTMGGRYILSDYDTGVLLPDNDHFAWDSETTHFFNFMTAGGQVDMYVTGNHSMRDDLDGYHYIFSSTLTVVAPDWYDGLVLSFVPQWDSYEDYAYAAELFNGIDSLIEVGDAPYEIQKALNCRILL